MIPGDLEVLLLNQTNSDKTAELGLALDWNSLVSEGILRVDVVREVKEAIGHLAQKNYDLVIFDTNSVYPGNQLADLLENGTPSPAAMAFLDFKLAVDFAKKRDTNKNVVVVAILENSAYQNFWRSTADCVYTKPEFYSRDKAGLKKVLKENFGIN